MWRRNLSLTITMHILLNISRSKCNQTMKFGQLIECYKRNIFLQKSCRKWGKETSSRPLFIFWKRFIWGKSKWSAVLCQYLWVALSLAYNKNKLYKTLNYQSRDLLDFDFLEGGLGIASLPHFVYSFPRKMFLMLYTINWPNFIV